ncbi:helix-turn-helix domain-containing protein [Desertihabitans aurantiacus]|uniref:helix-turn-helix domain-containing protein n=1 Tax=Desertihabitans aurantiacus TaxID=2282477 RepID=UPI001E472E20|nr:helix-turn-helix domain-containing protein [Desertihabitans aurantiacus]
MPEYFVPGPAALRALSHPVRLRMLGLLRLDGPATASQLAQRLDLNSGATSYHLRQLAAHGLVEDAADLGDRRERWWRAAQSVTSSRWSEDPEAQALWARFGQAAVSAQVQNLLRGAEEADEIAPDWQQTVTHNDLTLVLTPEQALEVRERVDQLVADLLDQYDVPDRQRPHDPADRRVPFMVQAHAFPRPGRAPRRPQPTGEER